MEVGNIITGDINKTLGLDQDIVEARRKICEKCPIYSSKNGGVCNSNLWINPENDDISFEEKPGFVRGCGCMLRFKWRDSSNKCIAGKW